MNVQIQSVKFDADKRLIEFVEAKMAKLDRFAERSTGAEVVLKLDKDHEKGNKIATITLHMPGEDLVACHQSKAFEESVDEAIDALKRQLDKFKGKFDNKYPLPTHEKGRPSPARRPSSYRPCIPCIPSPVPTGRCGLLHAVNRPTRSRRHASRSASCPSGSRRACSWRTR